MSAKSRKRNYNQVVVWPSTNMGDSTPEEFEAFMLEHFGIRIQFLEWYETAPNIKNGKPVPKTGGRPDLVFAIHDEDLNDFTPLHAIILGIFPVEIIVREDLKCEDSEIPILPAHLLDYCAPEFKKNLQRAYAA